MSFSSTGYEVEDLSTIMERIYQAFTSVLPNLEFTPDNIITHWQEILAYEQRLTEVMLGQAIDNFSVLTATGVFLTRLGIEAGIIRKPALNSSGDLLVIGDSDNTNQIPSGTLFTTLDGRGFYTTTGYYFPEVIQVTRSATIEDDIPAPYKYVTVTGLYTDGSLTTGISTGYYTYSGDVISWTADGLTNGPSEGTLYYAGLSGSVGLILPVISEDVGASYNVSANRITVDPNGFDFVESVTNEEPFYNGSDAETDDEYRYRIIRARRKTFTLDRIESLAENIIGVRDAKTYQVTSTDRNNLGYDYTDSGQVNVPWDENNLTGITGNIYAPSGKWFGISFYPTDKVATIKEIVLYGRVNGTVPSAERVYPKLEVYLKPHYSGAYLIDTGYYLTKTYIEHYSLERDNYTGWQEIKIPLKYNGIDNSKTYKVYFRESGYIDSNTGCWEFVYNDISVSSGYRNESYEEGTGMATKQILMRTMWAAPAYNMDIICEDGYRFDPEIKNKIEKILNYEEYDGNSPVCIQYNIREAVKTFLSLSMTMFPEEGYNFADVVSDIKTNVGTYLRTIKSGDSIYYTKLESVIMNTNGVLKIKNMKMKLNNGDWVDRTTQNDIKLGEKEYVDLDLSTLYDGVTILEG